MAPRLALALALAFLLPSAILPALVGTATAAHNPSVETARVKVIRVHFADYPDDSRFGYDGVVQMFDEISLLWRNNSYGHLNVVADINEDMYELPDDRADYVVPNDNPGDTRTLLDWSKMLQDAVDLLARAERDALTDFVGLAVVNAETASITYVNLGGGCTVRTAIGRTQSFGCAILSENPDQARMDLMGRWAHEVGHAFQARGASHPSNYNSEFELLDSNYPGQSSAYVRQEDTDFPGWLPTDRVVTFAPGPGGAGGGIAVIRVLERDQSTFPNRQVVKVELSDSLYYLVSARRRILGDELNSDLGGIPDEGVLIERVTEGADPPVAVQGNGNRNTLWDRGDTFESVADGVFIEVLRNGTGLEDYFVRVAFTKQANKPDIHLNPWRSPPGDAYETTDIWIDSQVNGYGTFRFGTWAAPQGDIVPVGNGDAPAVNQENRVYARVRNLGTSTASNAIVHIDVHTPLGMGINDGDEWTEIGAVDAGDFPGLAAIGPGAFTDVFVPWVPDVELTEEQREAGIFNFHTCVRVRVESVSGETVTSNQDGNDEQENIDLFEVPTDVDSDHVSGFYLSNARDVRRYYVLEYPSNLPAGWSLDVNGGDSTLLVGPRERVFVPVSLRAEAGAPVGAVHGIEVGAFALRVFTNPDDPTDVHHGLELIGGVRFEGRALVFPTISCEATREGSGVLVRGKLERISITDQALPVQVLLRAGEKQVGPPLASVVTQAAPDGRFTASFGNRTKVPDGSVVECLFAGTDKLAAASSGPVEIREGENEPPPTSGADLLIRKVARGAKSPALRDSVLEPSGFLIEVENKGPDTAFGVKVTDRLPAGFAFSKATANSGSCDEERGVVTCSLPLLGKGDKATFVILGDFTTPKAVVNTATVSARTNDPDPSNNAASTSEDGLAAPSSGTTTATPTKTPGPGAILLALGVLGAAFVLRRRMS